MLDGFYFFRIPRVSRYISGLHTLRVYVALSGLWGILWLVTQGVALGYDIVAPLGLLAKIVIAKQS